MKRRRLLLTTKDSPEERAPKKAAEGHLFIMGEDRSTRVHRERVAREIQQDVVAGKPIPQKTV